MSVIYVLLPVAGLLAADIEPMRAHVLDDIGQQMRGSVEAANLPP